MVKWPKNCIKVDEDRLLTEEECGYYWLWECTDDPVLMVKRPGSMFFASSIYVKLQDTPPEKPEPINVFDDGWYRVILTRGRGMAFRERRSDGGAYDVGGVPWSLCFDTEYSEYERVIGFGKVVKP